MVLYCGESICVREKPFPGTFNQLAPSSLIHNCLLRDSLPRRSCIHNHYLLMFRFMAFINHNDVHNWRFNLELATRFQAIDSRIIFTFTSFLCMFIKFVMLPSFSPKSSFRSLRCVSFPCEITSPTGWDTSRMLWLCAYNQQTVSESFLFSDLTYTTTTFVSRPIL